MGRDAHSMKRKLPEIVYYDDELNDEFSTAVITPRKIDDAYTYIRTGWWRKLTHVFWYRVVAYPMAWLYLKIKFSHKVVGRQLLKAYRKDGYFLYGNHTQAIADALIPTMLGRPKDVYVIVHPNNVSMPFLGRITPSLGALPLPDTWGATRNFLKAIAQRAEEGHVICIYPEAHIWPYYTGIRHFREPSFQYPIRYGKPTFCFTNTYQQRRPGGKIRIVTYVDGPFFPDSTLHGKAQVLDLRDRVWKAMNQRAALNQVDYVRYVRRTDSPDTDTEAGPSSQEKGRTDA